MLERLKRGLTHLGIWLIALVLLFEEWGWERLASILAWFGRLPGLRWIEARIRALPPYGALALFALPVLALLPIKLLALYWLGHGHTLLGISVIVAAKLGGTALTARLFMLTQPVLMQLPWFARWFTRWLNWKNSVLARLRQTPSWLTMMALVTRIKATSRALIQSLKNIWRQR
jgi:hypothetical protein